MLTPNIVLLLKTVEYEPNSSIKIQWDGGGGNNSTSIGRRQKWNEEFESWVPSLSLLSLMSVELIFEHIICPNIAKLGFCNF